MAREWSAEAVSQLLAALATHGGFITHGKPSEAKLAHAFDMRQSTLNSWKRAKRESSTLRDFLRVYAETYGCDEIALLHEWRIAPAGAARALPPLRESDKARAEEFTELMGDPVYREVWGRVATIYRARKKKPEAWRKLAEDLSLLARYVGEPQKKPARRLGDSFRL